MSHKLNDEIHFEDFWRWMLRHWRVQQLPLLREKSDKKIMSLIKSSEGQSFFFPLLFFFFFFSWRFFQLDIFFLFEKIVYVFIDDATGLFNLHVSLLPCYCAINNSRSLSLLVPFLQEIKTYVCTCLSTFSSTRFMRNARYINVTAIKIIRIFLKLRYTRCILIRIIIFGRKTFSYVTNDSISLRRGCSYFYRKLKCAQIIQSRYIIRYNI